VISKKIVERFDGTIGFKSKWLKGSTFGFRIQLENELENTNVTQQSKNAKNSLDMLDTERWLEDQD
jgi:light-regulated signal transduction histidine kinase (bacteriophytochrome)